MKKRIKQKTLVLGGLFLATPLLIISSCNAVEKKETTPTITKQVEDNTRKVIDSNVTKKPIIQPVIPVLIDLTPPKTIIPTTPKEATTPNISSTPNETPSVTVEPNTPAKPKPNIPSTPDETPIVTTKPITPTTPNETPIINTKPNTTVVITPVRRELTKDNVIEWGWNKVTSLTKEMFQDKIPGITHIGRGAFASNKLTSLEIPDSVISIGSRSFYSNQLTSLEIPDSVISIGDESFVNNPITTLKIGNKTKIIGWKAFSGCPITNLSLGNSLQTIGSWAFESHKISGIIILPHSLSIIKNSVGEWAFYRSNLGFAAK